MRQRFRDIDAGLSPLFADNAEKMGLDLNNVDFAVLSHAHDDHANGLDRFFELNDHAPLYVASGCDENCYDKKKLFYKYAGIPRGIMKRHADRIIKANEDMVIADGIRLLGQKQFIQDTAQERKLWIFCVESLEAKSML